MFSISPYHCLFLIHYYFTKCSLLRFRVFAVTIPPYRMFLMNYYLTNSRFPVSENLLPQSLVPSLCTTTPTRSPSRLSTPNIKSRNSSEQLATISSSSAKLISKSNPTTVSCLSFKVVFLLSYCY